ncbi:hypothetical protein QTP86_027597, partial [Hemibagrus guttatus]
MLELLRSDLQNTMSRYYARLLRSPRTQTEISIVCTAYPIYHRGAIGHQGRIHPGQSANPSQGTHTLIHYGQFRDSNQPRSMSLDCGRKPEHPEETHQARGEHANPIHSVSGSKTRPET